MKNGQITPLKIINRVLGIIAVLAIFIGFFFVMKNVSGQADPTQFSIGIIIMSCGGVLLVVSAILIIIDYNIHKK